MSTQYERCLNELGGENATDREILGCVATRLENENNLYAQSIMLVFASALVFFMQAGFAMVCAGAVRKKNVQNTSTSQRPFESSKSQQEKCSAQKSHGRLWG